MTIGGVVQHKSNRRGSDLYFKDGTYTYIITDRRCSVHKIPLWKILNGIEDENEYL